MISQSLIFALALAQPCNYQATGPLPATPTLADVQYGIAIDPYTRIDFYLPSPTFMPVGIVIEIHGGGWWNGDKGNFQQYERELHQGIDAGFVDECWARGLAVASIQYHLVEPPAQSPCIPGQVANAFPTGAHDVARAIQFVRGL